MGRNLGDSECYHCSAAVPPGIRLGLMADGRWQAVCCPGCELVAKMIQSAGLDAYYRMRDAPAARLDGYGNAVSEAEDLGRFDAPEVQAEFVARREAGLEAVLLLEGVRCSACLWLIESVLARVAGVLEARVNYTTQRARVLWDPSQTRLSELLRAVRRFGYRAVPWVRRHEGELRSRERRSMLLRLLVAGLGMMQVMMYALPAYIAADGDLPPDLEQLMRIAGLLLTTPVLLYSAGPFFSGAWRSLRQRRLGMDVPIAAGVAIAYAASLAAMTGVGREVYFDSISMLVFLILAGRFLELLARQRAADVLAYLGGSVPEFADRLGDHPRSSSVERIHVSALRPGERVLVRAGEAVPADGVVLSGISAVEEAAISGESQPVRKSAGSPVYAGTVNTEQALVVRIERAGADTLVSNIARLAERAAGDKPPLTALAERFTGAFIASVLLMAASAGLWWFLQAPERAVPVMIAVLVATCPCAFALATPVTRAITLAVLARRGLVVTRGEAIEVLAGVTDVVLDKTGTLTHGTPHLIAVETRRGWSAEACLRIAAALESSVSHPIARALQRAAPDAALPATASVQVIPGAGVQAEVGGRRYRIGHAGFAGGFPDECSSAAAFAGERVVLADADGPIAAFRISDEVRGDAGGMVAGLRTLGLEIHLLSGDAQTRVQGLARRFGIACARSRALPDDKRAYVRALQESGRKVLMVGDGVNDAPVMAQADVSIALGSGAALAQTRADAVLLNSRLSEVVLAVMHVRRARAVIRQNLWWAFAYNISVLPLAVAGELAPWAAALGMSASSLLVLGNALRVAGSPDAARARAADAAPIAAPEAAA